MESCGLGTVGDLLKSLLHVKVVISCSIIQNHTFDALNEKLYAKDTLAMYEIGRRML